MSRPHLLARLTILSLLHGLLWVAIVPPWQTPDEPKHFEYVRLLAASDEVVAFATEAEAANPELQRQILRSMDEHRFWWYGRAPGYDPDNPPERFADAWVLGMHTAFYRSSPVYYWLVARFQPESLLVGLYLARTFSVVLGALVVFLTGWTARELFPDDPLVRYGAPAFVALTPMFAFVQAGVNNDALVNFLAALAFLLMARLLVRGMSLARLIMLAAVIALAVFTKRTALFLVPVGALATLMWLAFRSRRPARVIAGGGVALLVVLAGVWAWWAGGGAESVPQEWRWNALRYFFNEPDQPGRILAVLRTPAALPEIGRYLWGMHNSFWGSFGWHIVHFPTVFYVALAGIGLAAAAGVVRLLFADETTLAQRAALITWAVALAVAALGATAFFASYLILPYPPPPQGRYLFAAMVPIAVLLCAGLGSWVDEGRRWRALSVGVGSLVVFDLVALVGFVVPWFYR